MRAAQLPSTQEGTNDCSTANAALIIPDTNRATAKDAKALFANPARAARIDATNNTPPANRTLTVGSSKEEGRSREETQTSMTTGRLSITTLPTTRRTGFKPTDASRTES